MRYDVIPERSRVWAEARSSLHPVRMETAGIQGFLEADVSAAEVRLAPSARIEFPVELLKSNNAILDSELQRRLEVRKYPRIEGDLRQVEALGGERWLLRGELTLHGIRQPMDVEVAVAVTQDTLELTGEKVIDMRAFGLQPPRLLFLRVEPQVRIRARLVAMKP
jgi:polyisoprenoid-binding protein YceI